MRVLYLTMNPNRESTTVPTEGWFRLLRGQGLEPVLISHKSGAFQQWAAGEGIPSYEIPLPFPSRRRPWRFLRSLASVVAIARRHRVQILHCNEHDIYPIGQYAARLLGVPVVLSVHFTLRDGFSRWAFGGARCPSRVFFLSKGSLEACRPDIEGVVPESRWRVLYNGLDMNRFCPDPCLRDRFRAEHGLQDVTAVGVACALRPRKQLEHLFQAAAAVDAPTLRVVVAGGPVGGDEEYAEALLANAKKMLGNRLILLGHMRDLRGFYNGLDLFVNTSQEEACSISIIESLASGLPILGYPSTSVDEQVLPDGGEIVSQDSIEDLSAAFQRWISNPAKMMSARTGARQRAESTFDIRKLSEQLWSEYQKVAAA